MSNLTAKKAFTDVIKDNKRLAAELESLRAAPDVDDWKLLVAECYQHGSGVRGIAAITGNYNAMAADLANVRAELAQVKLERDAADECSARQMKSADLLWKERNEVQAQLAAEKQRAHGLEVERNALHNTVARLMLGVEPKA